MTEFHKNSARADGVQTYCKPCMNLRNKEWVKANPEKVKANSRKHYLANKDAVCEKSKLWASNNPDKVKQVQQECAKRKRVSDLEHCRRIGRESRARNIDKRRASDRERYLLHTENRKASVRQWRIKHADVLNQYSKKRKATKLHSTPGWANAFFISEAYRLAKLRERIVGGKWHVDHIVPLQSRVVCGLHVEHNLQVIPAAVNIRKHNRVWPDMP